MNDHRQTKVNFTEYNEKVVQPIVAAPCLVDNQTNPWTLLPFCRLTKEFKSKEVHVSIFSDRLNEKRLENGILRHRCGQIEYADNMGNWVSTCVKWGCWGERLHFPTVLFGNRMQGHGNAVIGFPVNMTHYINLMCSLSQNQIAVTHVLAHGIDLSKWLLLRMQLFDVW